ncbi:host cell division inhibitor Icd-like protein [Salmonella enterica]
MSNNITSCGGVNVSVINRLHWLAILSYAYPAPHKTGAGRGNPKLLEATQDAESVFFVVRYTRHSMAGYCSCEERSHCGPQGYMNEYHATHNGGVCSECCAKVTPYHLAPMNAPRHPIMVTLAGQSQGWPVSSNAGISTPVNVTALFERGNSGGDSVNLLEEAATMATTPAQTPLFVWRFVSGQNSTCFTTTAASEREARLQLPAVRLVFAARIRVEEVYHA